MPMMIGIGEAVEGSRDSVDVTFKTVYTGYSSKALMDLVWSGHLLLCSAVLGVLC